VLGLIAPCIHAVDAGHALPHRHAEKRGLNSTDGGWAVGGWPSAQALPDVKARATSGQKRINFGRGDFLGLEKAAALIRSAALSPGLAALAIALQCEPVER
jgi:hypothetical protein